MVLDFIGHLVEFWRTLNAIGIDVTTIGVAQQWKSKFSLPLELLKLVNNSSSLNKGNHDRDGVWSNISKTSASVSSGFQNWWKHEATCFCCFINMQIKKICIRVWNRFKHGFQTRPCFQLVFHWVSKPIHLTRIRCSGWVRAAWIINEFDLK